MKSEKYLKLNDHGNTYQNLWNEVLTVSKGKIYKRKCLYWKRLEYE